MHEITISLQDLPNHLKKLSESNTQALERAVRRTLQVDAHRWIQWSIRGGDAPKGGYRVPIDTSDYASSWKTEVSGTDGVIYSAARPPEKAGVIEAGRRPAGIPIEPLAAWVKRKLGVSDPKVARSIAFAISKKASKTPRAGLNVLGRAHPKIVEALRRNVQRELEKDRKP